MTRNLGKLFLMLCLLTVGGVVANAQIDLYANIQANVPFAFSVGDTTLPAGKYEIVRLDDNLPNVLEIRSANSRTRVLFETEVSQERGGQPVAKTELAFNKVGDDYFLNQIWVAGDASGNELPRSRMEKRLMASGSTPERRSIAGFLRRMKH